jgi:oxygen-independent coproporphyrinogen-3 oxidase
VEPGTAFGKWYAPGLFPLAPEADVANFYRQASKSLNAAGYEHYELSSYALRPPDTKNDHAPMTAGATTGAAAATATAPLMAAAAVTATAERGVDLSSIGLKSRHRSRHNACYWAMRPFLAFGLGASSMVAPGARVARPRDATGYANFVASLEDTPPTDTSETTRAGSGGNHKPHAARALLLGEASTLASSSPNPAYEALLEGLMVALRTSDGFDLDACARAFGPKAAHAIAAAALPAQARGLAQLVGLGGGGPASAAAAAHRHASSAGVADAEGNAEGDTKGNAEGDTKGSAEGSSRGTLRLTDPEGFLFSNDVISTLFAALKPEMIRPPALEMRAD